MLLQTDVTCVSAHCSVQIERQTSPQEARCSGKYIPAEGAQTNPRIQNEEREMLNVCAVSMEMFLSARTACCDRLSHPCSVPALSHGLPVHQACNHNARCMRLHVFTMPGALCANAVRPKLSGANVTNRASKGEKSYIPYWICNNMLLPRSYVVSGGCR
jgi:hypothetical protein